MLTESVAPTTGKVAVRILADDILPDAPRDSTRSSSERLRWAGALWLWRGLWARPAGPGLPRTLVTADTSSALRSTRPTTDCCGAGERPSNEPLASWTAI